MPRYFFHVRSHDDLHEDCEGMDLPDLKAALDEALRTDRELTSEPIGMYDLEFEITDPNGRTLLRVPVQANGRNELLAVPQLAEERQRSTDKKRALH
jgi:hypothetical protein